jgi:hypothetical protein
MTERKHLTKDEKRAARAARQRGLYTKAKGKPYARETENPDSDYMLEFTGRFALRVELDELSPKAREFFRLLRW